MIVLNRESIIEGLIEIRKEEDLENSIIVNNIKSIIDLNDISNLDKLKLINNELGKIIFDEMSKTWEYKELVYQFNLAKELSQKENFDVDTSWLINFKKHGSSFSANLPKDYLCKNINYINYVSGTVAYDILRKMSYC